MRDLAEWRPAFPCGAGQTERAIEIPWALSRYNGGRRVLEVGCSFASENPEYIRGLIALNIPELHGIDISSVEAPHFLSAAQHFRMAQIGRKLLCVLWIALKAFCGGQDSIRYRVEAFHQDSIKFGIVPVICHT